MLTIGLELKISRPDIVSRKLVKDVAREADISRPHLSRIENGHILPIPEVEVRLKRIVDWRPAVRDYLQQVLARPCAVQGTASAVQAAASETNAAANNETGASQDAPHLREQP
jgi:transcriptional regulator with XRE-family HTH domain